MVRFCKIWLFETIMNTPHGGQCYTDWAQGKYFKLSVFKAILPSIPNTHYYYITQSDSVSLWVNVPRSLGHMRCLHLVWSKSPRKSKWRDTGPTCSKLTTSLVNDSLKFTSNDTQICWNFLLKKCEQLLQCKSYSHFFSKKYQNIVYWVH